jgi:glycosyltransferase involved in cell wall biosynthesis
VSAGRKLLFLAPFAPSRDAAHGGGRAMAGLISRLAARHQVRLLCLRGEREPPVDDVLRERCEEVLELPRPGGIRSAGGLNRRLSRYSRTLLSPFAGQPKWAWYCAVPALSNALRKRAASWQPDLVQMEYCVMGQYEADLAGNPVPLVLNQYDPGAAAARDTRRSARGLARVAAGFDWLAWERFERRVLRRMNAVVALTDRDREALQRLAPGVPITTIPLGSELPEHPLDPVGDDPPRVLFVGSFRHPPNVAAAERLLRGIFPAIRARVPEACLDLVGEALPESLRREAGPGVKATGWVASVEPYLDRAAVVVAPLEQGGGMRVKVMEALAAGKAVVASPRALAGLDGIVDRSGGKQGAALVGHDDAEIAEAVISLLEDRAGRAALAGRARAWAEENLGWDRAVAAYEELYERLIAQRPDRP